MLPLLRDEPAPLPEHATFIGKPFNHHMVIDHLQEKLPDGKKPEPLKTAA